SNDLQHGLGVGGVQNRPQFVGSAYMVLAGPDGFPARHASVSAHRDEDRFPLGASPLRDPDPTSNAIAPLRYSHMTLRVSSVFGDSTLVPTRPQAGRSCRNLKVINSLYTRDCGE